MSQKHASDTTSNTSIEEETLVPPFPIQFYFTLGVLNFRDKDGQAINEILNTCDDGVVQQCLPYANAMAAVLDDNLAGYLRVYETDFVEKLFAKVFCDKVITLQTWPSMDQWEIACMILCEMLEEIHEEKN